ncbi:MAG: flagellar hook-associated protein FlgK [Armatimonadota bacterium]|nr:flagellar hook-associated protein FlgK [Armatimonadota bacterium]MDR7444100.1 flagellar hook-associated protein FlgK [Armatimonadota bacterium]MDR7569517.1 flagellar hook-associated protein FlgK [Armatimonadota bacterium]MDR7613549.1 flagellar hook-associated protein FlgK [Armatimonadota bacterium]
MTSFATLELLRRALAAQQQAMDVTGHNIANVNTPGYTRQEVVLSSQPPPGGLSRFGATLLVGGGVRVAALRQARDAFLDRQLRGAQQSSAEWKARADFWSQVEAIFPEPSDSGLGELLSRFWNAWQEVSLNPESLAARTSLAQQAQMLADALRQSAQRLVELRQHLDAVATGHVQRVNQIGRELANLNTQISRLELSGQRALDLRDHRDQLLAELEELVDVTYTETETGELLVYLQGRELVGPGGRATEIGIEPPPPGGVHGFRWPDGEALAVRRGTLAAVLQARDGDIGTLRERLDQLARNLIERVNDLHDDGFDLDGLPGGPFFEGSDAGTIRVADAIREDPRRIAAASTWTGDGEPGNGGVALRIAQLRGSEDLDGLYRMLVTEVGVRAQESDRQVAYRDLLTDQLRLRREATSGVSLDEEMTNMLRYQHAYEAAARMVRTVDEMIRTLLGMVGG